MDNNQIWQAVLGEIELNLSKASFTTWFKNTFISSFENEKVIIGTPNMFTQTWLEKKYHKEICSALENVTGQKIKGIVYKIESKKNNPVEIKVKIEKKEETKAPKKESLPFQNNITTNKFGLNFRYIFENFIVGKGNELAHAACQAVSSNPGNAYNPLVIYGGVGLGKTHLLQAVGHEVCKYTGKVLYVTSEKFSNDYIQAVRSGQAKEFKNRYRNVDLLLIDDVQFMAGKDGTQEEFFHTFNELHQANKQIVLTSDRHPKSIPALEKRLISRFEAGMVVDIVQPDVETKLAILKKKSKERNFYIDEDVLFYVANNIKNNIRELEGALNKIIAFNEFNNTVPSVENTKNIINDLINTSSDRKINCQDILAVVAKYYNLNIKDLIGKGRKKELVWPRQIAAFLMREEANISYPTIGQELGGRDHTTAIHAFNKINQEIKEKQNEKIKQEIFSIKQLLQDMERVC